MRKYQLLTDALVRKLYNHVEEFTKQKKGCSADYIVDGVYCLEVKLDMRAKDTGNIFVEYANKNKDEVKDSGIALSADAGYSVLYLLPDTEHISAYQIPATTLLALAKAHGKEVETRPGINGNRPGFSALGYKLPIYYISTWLVRQIKKDET